MIREIFISGFMIMLLTVPTLVADSKAGGQTNTLPWEIIAEKFDSKDPFCRAKSKDGKTDDFALAPDELTLILPSNNIKIPQGQTEAKLNLSRWQRGQWADLSPVTANIDPNGLTVNSNAIAEGFYCLSVVFDKSDFGKENDYYAVITADWKKDLLRWCQKNKEQIETDPDTQLIHSSIVVSHFDHVMELAIKSQVLSENIISALSKAVKAKKDFDNGNCPDLVIGLNKIRLKRFEGASIEEFVVFVSEAYNKSKPGAVFLHPDNRRWSAKDYNYYSIHHSGLIDIWWHTVDDKNINWKDFQYFFDTLKQKLNIDDNRIYVNGECGNGLAAMSLALNFPDQWAECSMSLGNTYRHMAGNALNLPLIFVKGAVHLNEGSLVSYYDFAVECFKYHGCRFFRHSKSLSIAQVRGSSVPSKTRDLSPYRVSYTIESLANPDAYWVQIDGREDENFIASVDAIVWGQSILVKTDNVDSYTLNLELAPLDHSRPVEIVENDKFLETVIGPVFVRKSPKHEMATYIKNESLHGPVSDVFTDRYAVVWKGDNGIKRFAEQLAGSGPCFDDADLPAEFIETHNIIFVGKLDESLHFAQITGKLPVVIEDGRLTAKEEVYEGDLGAVFICPNPLNSKKYIAIFSGTSDKALDLLSSAWQQIKSKDNTDVGIFKVSKNNKIDLFICEKFNTVWDWHKSWDTPLANLTKTYPKWKWRQWITMALRKQLNADVMILEDTFSLAQLPDFGELTLRDISRIIKNDWIVKISLKGSDLRELLTVSFKANLTRDVSAPVIDGVSLVKQSAGSNVICINELEVDRLYAVALPYKAVNGNRMGMLMKNYRLEGQGFAVILMKEYLKENNDIDLDSVKVNIY